MSYWPRQKERDALVLFNNGVAMSSKDARRLSNNARRGKRAICSIAIGLGILSAFPTDALATRGRVKVTAQR